MKKIALVFMVFSVFGLSSNAFVDNQFMQTEQYLVNTGYSKEMARVMKIISQDPYRDVYVEGKRPQDYGKRVLNYIAPTEYTDINFYNHNSNFDNTNWRDL